MCYCGLDDDVWVIGYVWKFCLGCIKYCCGRFVEKWSGVGKCFIN